MRGFPCLLSPLESAVRRRVSGGVALLLFSVFPSSRRAESILSGVRTQAMRCRYRTAAVRVLGVRVERKERRQTIEDRRSERRKERRTKKREDRPPDPCCSSLFQTSLERPFSFFLFSSRCGLSLGSPMTIESLLSVLSTSLSPCV